MTGKEIIVVRSLTDSDFGLFAAHRSGMASKQRAIAIVASVARQMLSRELYDSGGAMFECSLVYGDETVRSQRTLSKTGKNWRLGGKKIEGAAFASLDSKDFVLIRAIASNDGSVPLSINFVGRNKDRVAHAGLAAIVERQLESSMVVFEEGSDGFEALKPYCQAAYVRPAPPPRRAKAPKKPKAPAPAIAPMPRDRSSESTTKKPTIHEKVRSPHIMERMFKVAGDLSAPAQLRFIEIVEQLASQLRTVLLETGGIVAVKHDHKAFWPSVAGKPIGFIDGGLANLSMLGSAPIAARVGGYMVTPGQTGPDREQFMMLKHLIDELYAHADGGVYENSFPDIGALRDAARISVEAAGAVQMLRQFPEVKWILMHGALVNPVSRYTDIMEDRLLARVTGRVRHRFPNFSDSALEELLPGEPTRTGPDRNFISVYLRQLQILRDAAPIVCGVVEREATTSSVIRSVLDSLDEHAIAKLLPVPPAEWKTWFRHQIDPSDDPDSEGERITDSLLFRCVLEPGEALKPVMVDRNERRRAPPAWRDDYIVYYPPPYVSYVQVSEWSPPIRLEMFKDRLGSFDEAAALVSHCALLLPRYSFPVGLDIVDKFAKVPNWMTKPIAAYTTVQALKRALDSGDTKSFDALRRILCGSNREWLLRPSINR